MTRTVALVRTLPLPRLRLIGVPILFAALMAAASYVRIPIPGSPVPMTMQVVVVLVAGGLLAPGAAASAMILFTLAGAAGLPVFQGGGGGILHLAGPTGGYILGFIAAAPLISCLAGARRDASLRVVLAMVSGLGLIHLTGMTQLAIYFGGDFLLAFTQGVLPFLPLDLVKIAVAVPVVMAVGSLTANGGAATSNRS